MTEREFAIDVVRRLQEKGHAALWAGGCVRDDLLGLEPKDYDVATDARPEQVQSLFRRALAVGASFGVIDVLGPRQREGGRQLSVEVATFRTDVSYSDGRRPDHVIFSSAREDALRRDFTINGMFFDPLKGELIDYVNGQTDLHARILRAIGNPGQRFEEDKLRLLRAVRLATRFELTIEPATEAAIKAHAAKIHVVSAERITEELRQLLVHPRRSQGVKLLHRLGLVEPLLPELSPIDEERLLTVLEYLGPEPTFPLALAGLLHDIGRSRLPDVTCDTNAAEVPPGRRDLLETPSEHWHTAARLADGIGLRFRLSNSERERAVWLVGRQHVLNDIRTMRTCRVKQLLNHPGIHELLALHRAVALAEGRTVGGVEYCQELLRKWTAEDLDPAPLITGQVLIEMGLKPGPKFKEILDAVRDAQLDGAIHTKEEAMELARRLALE